MTLLTTAANPVQTGRKVERGLPKEPLVTAKQILQKHKFGEDAVINITFFTTGPRDPQGIQINLKRPLSATEVGTLFGKALPEIIEKTGRTPSVNSYLYRAPARNQDKLNDVENMLIGGVNLPRGFVGIVDESSDKPVIYAPREIDTLANSTFLEFVEQEVGIEFSFIDNQ